MDRNDKDLLYIITKSIAENEEIVGSGAGAYDKYTEKDFMSDYYDIIEGKTENCLYKVGF